MNLPSLAKIGYHCALLSACVTLSCRPQQTVLAAPGEDELVVLNGCVVSACNYLAAMKTQHALDKSFWAKILLVRYSNHPAGHAYCVWETDEIGRASCRERVYISVAAGHVRKE